MADPTTTSSGVSQLISRLKQDGVAAGEAEADRIIAQAEQEAARIRVAAETEAKALRDAAEKDAQASERAGREALNLAARDMLLRLREDLSHHFIEYLGRQVTTEMQDKTVLDQMILAVAGRARPEQLDAAELLLPEQAVDMESLRKQAADGRSDPLAPTVAGLTQDMLADGVVLAEGGPNTGLRLRLEGGEVEIDLSDAAIVEQLSRHLLPRFRALLEGVAR